MEHESADISVVIPYYNREQYIDEAVQSVLAQTLKPLEIIIVNDCSRPSSRRCLDRYAGVCTIIDLPVNAGSGAARNEGIRRARGRFIAFLDDDDIWLPGKLEMQRRYMAEHPGCDVVHSAVSVFYSDRPDRIMARDWPRPVTLAQVLRLEGWVWPQTMLIRADVVRALEGFDRRVRIVEDGDFTYRCAAAGYRIESIREPLARVRRQGQEGMTKNTWLTLLAYIGLWWKHKALYYRVYGMRGVVSSLMASLDLGTRKVRYAGGVVRRLLRLIPVKWEVRSDYQEPVQVEVSPAASPAGFPRDE